MANTTRKELIDAAAQFLRQRDLQPEAEARELKTQWDQFCELYVPLVEKDCRRWPLDTDEAHERLSEIWIDVIALLKGPFEYRPNGKRRKFRGLLYTITRATVASYLERRRKRGAIDARLPTTDLRPLPETSRRQPSREVERKEDATLLEAAFRRLEGQMSARHFTAARMYLEERYMTARDLRRTAEEIGKELGMSAENVRKVAQRALRMLRDILRDLEGDGAEKGR